MVYLVKKGNLMELTLKFGDKVAVADVRKLHDMEDVLFDKEWFRKTEEINKDIYYMFRDLTKNDDDLEVIKGYHLRYDITVIPPGMLGLEYTKTVGHYHPQIPGQTFLILKFIRYLKVLLLISFKKWSMRMRMSFWMS